jgi:hypothetical protein
MNLSPIEASPRTSASSGEAEGEATGSVLRGGFLRFRLPEKALSRFVRG